MMNVSALFEDNPMCGLSKNVQKSQKCDGQIDRQGYFYLPTSPSPPLTLLRDKTGNVNLIHGLTSGAPFTNMDK